MPLSANTVVQVGTTAGPNTSIIRVWYTEYVSQLNSSIAYGTNKLPIIPPELDPNPNANLAFAPYFGGNTAGVTSNTSPAIPYDIGHGSPGNTSINTTALTTSFINAINQWGTIRQARYLYNVIGGDTTVLDTGIGYLNGSFYIATPSPVPPQAGQIISATGNIPSPGTLTYTTPGSYNWTVPQGVTSLNLTVYGGGGGAGGHDGGGYGHDGYAGTIMTGTISVSPGDAINVIVGGGGGGGASGATGTGGGTPGSSAYQPGGRGGNAGGSGSSGAGGGGGGASAVRVNGTAQVVAAGGGGGGGASNGPNGQAANPSYTNGTSIDGGNRSGDGGGGGAGGGGNPSGVGGQSAPSDGVGAWSGFSGTSTGTGFSQAVGTNGGPADSGAGGPGSVVITYTPPPETKYPIQGFIQALYENYVGNVRNVTTDVTVSVCHSSCHSSCHGSRGRR